MTYNEALKERDSKGKFRIDNGVKWLLLIVPNKTEDFENFMRQLNAETHNDEDCIKFSTNYKFKFQEVPHDYFNLE